MLFSSWCVRLTDGVIEMMAQRPAAGVSVTLGGDLQSILTD